MAARKAEDMPKIAVAVKAFGNGKTHEGVRVKPGTRFAIGQPSDGLPVMTENRFRELKRNGLVRGFGEEDTAAAPRARTATPVIKTEDVTRVRPTNARAASRKRTRAADAPAPEKIETTESAQGENPAGSPNGPGTSPSSSRAGRASVRSTSGQRGERRD